MTKVEHVSAQDLKMNMYYSGIGTEDSQIFPQKPQVILYTPKSPIMFAKEKILDAYKEFKKIGKEK